MSLQMPPDGVVSWNKDRGDWDWHIPLSRVPRAWREWADHQAELGQQIDHDRRAADIARAQREMRGEPEPHDISEGGLVDPASVVYTRAQSGGQGVFMPRLSMLK